MMKNKASLFLKQIMSLLSSTAKAKSIAIKNKASTFKTRLMMLSLLKNKKFLMASITNKIHGMLAHRDEEDSENEDNTDQSKAIVHHNANANEYSISSSTQLEENIDGHLTNNSYCYYDDNDDDEDKYPDLRHSLFDEEEFDDPGGSVIDMVKNSKEDGDNFVLEDEIDHVADLFIMRFYKQIRLQKLDSFKRYEDKLARSV